MAQQIAASAGGVPIAGSGGVPGINPVGSGEGAPGAPGDASGGGAGPAAGSSSSSGVGTGGGVAGPGIGEGEGAPGAPGAPAGAPGETSGNEGGPVGDAAAAAGAGAGAGAGDAGTVICTELHRQGYLDESVWIADVAFGQRQSQATRDGYRLWAAPIARGMARSRVLTLVVAALALPWAQEMAFRTGASSSGSRVGRVAMAIGLPICSAIGHVITRRAPSANAGV